MNKIIERHQLVLRYFLVFGLVACLCFTGASEVLAASQDAKVPRVKFQDVVAKAKALSKASFQAPGKDLPEVFKKIGYDQWRDIRFKPGRSLWVDQLFSVQFFHPGFLYQNPIIVHSIDRDGTHSVPFSSDHFDYASNELKGHLSNDYGFAGLRVHYPLNSSKYADELVAFLGASYFRALGKGLSYGLSARGLAVNTAENDGEEFPLFREFWIVHPAPGAKSITLYALLDSHSLTGAYEFVVVPGEETLMKVKSTLFIRQHVRKLGIAPLTSMFFYGENQNFWRDDDFRPEVHDSDGLLIASQSGEWIWHPLIDPVRLLINAFGGGQPVGFGLMQRDIDFDHYQDLEARYDRRPSLWISPQGDWGKGHLELVQLPTESEYNDNIVSYWVPERSFEPGDSVQYAYTLSWHSARHRKLPQSFVEATRIVRKSDGAMFMIDFAGEEFKTVLANKILEPDVWISKGGRITGSQLIRNVVTGGWRLVLHLQLDKLEFGEGVLPSQKPAIEFRAFLKDGARAVSEIWSYTYLP